MIILAIEQYRGYAEVGARILGPNYLGFARQWPIDEKEMYILERRRLGASELELCTADEGGRLGMPIALKVVLLDQA